jgi:arabinan endo-1,5-alpha-L-arabinosidase
MDPLDWKDEWPVVRGNRGPSADLQPAPAAQPCELNFYEASFKRPDEPGGLLAGYSDEFNTPTLPKQWHSIHPDASNSYTLTGSTYEVQTEGPDENGDAAHVSLLGEKLNGRADQAGKQYLLWRVDRRIGSGVCCAHPISDIQRTTE